MLGGGELPFARLAAGGNHTCGLTSDGGAYCWGSNTDGQLGDGTDWGAYTPVPVNTSLGFTQISVTGGTTCGIATDGFEYCWGCNHGYFGNGQEADSRTPVRVTNFP